MKCSFCLALIVVVAEVGLPGSISALQPADRSAMSAAFDDGVLPGPLALPAGNIDAVTANLANTIVSGKRDAVPALETALLVAGFGIRGARGGSDRSVLTLASHRQGIVFPAWQVAAMAKSFGDGRGVTLQQFADAMASGITVFGRLPLAAGVVVAIRSNADSPDPARRALGRLLLELGRHADTPYDLLSPKLDPTTIRLDAIQTALILARLAGDLGDLQSQRRRKQVSFVRSKSEDSFGLFRLAAYEPGRAFVSPEVAEEGESSPCESRNENESLIVDAGVAAGSTFFGKFWEWAAETIEAEELHEVASTALSAVVSLERLTNAMTAIHVDITMEGGLPFVRTPDNNAGERRVLTATVTADSGKWEALNCARYGLQMLGIDPKNLRSGPLRTGVEWRMRRNLDPNGLPQVLTSFDTTAARSSPASKTATNPVTTTDEHGVSRIYMTGNPQHTSLSRAQLHPVQKSVTILVDVQPKHFFDEPGADRKAEAIDVANMILKGFLLPTDALIETGGEVILRSYLPGGQKEIPVRDWGTHFYCGPNKQTYQTASACTASCHATLANFAGVCVPQ